MFLHPPPPSIALPAGGGGSRTADYDFASVFAVPTVANEDSEEAPAATTSVAQTTPSRSSVRGSDPVKPTGPTAPVSTSPGSPTPQTMTPSSDRIFTRTRRRSATAAGKAPPAVDYGFPAIVQMSYNSAASPTAAAGSARRRDPYSCRLAGPHGTTSVRSRPRRTYGNSSPTAYAFSW